MLRVFFILLVIFIAAFLFLQGRVNERMDEEPAFLRYDKIAAAHNTTIKTTVHSLYIPDAVKLKAFEKDYCNIWAHLNYLYETNNVEAGKEYYTEDWFQQINRHYNGQITTNIKRNDVQHDLHIENWSSDGLVCTVTDSNLVLKYQFPNSEIKKSTAVVNMVLLFQGDHWRIDAIRIKNEAFLE